MRTLQQIIDILLSDYKGRMPYVAKNSGLSYETVLRITRGKTKSPRISAVQKLDEFIDRDETARTLHKAKSDITLIHQAALAEAAKSENATV